MIIGKDANNLKPKLKFQVNDKYVTDSLEIANSFNEFFVSIGPKLADNILSTTNPLSYVNNCTNSIVIPPVTIAEVSQTILSMKNSSAGWDDFPARVAKQSIDSYIEPLTCLTPERPMGHICPMFFSCICYMNITKKTILNSRQFYFR